MKIKYIEIVLENCEVIRIEKNYLGYVHIGEIKTSMSKDLYGMSKYYICKDFAIEINRGLKNEKERQYLFGYLEEDRNPIERLNKFSDITQIEITYVDDSKEFYYVDWYEEDEYDNRFQKNKLNDFGDLYIVISEYRDIDYFFPDFQINDKELVEDSWKEYEEENK